MAKNDKKNREDEIRVVEEVGPADEEVVRLDSPQRGPVGRKMPSGEEQAMSGMMGDSAELEEHREAYFDPETAWTEEDQEQVAKSLPVGWLVLFGVLVAGIIFWATTQKSPSEKIVPVAGSEKGDGTVSSDDAAVHFTSMEKVVTGFLAATTIEERAQYIRDPERVVPLMRNYFQRNEFRSYVFKEATEYYIGALDNFPFIALRVEVENHEGLPILLEDGVDGMKVDWESFVSYQPMDPEVFLKERPLEPLDFRVYAQADDFYAFDFADETKFACYMLTFRHSDALLYGYVERGTQLEAEFAKVFNQGRGGGGQNPLILSLSFLPGSRAPSSVLIHSLKSKIWAYPPGAAAASSTSTTETSGQ